MIPFRRLAINKGDYILFGFYALRPKLRGVLIKLNSMSVHTRKVNLGS